jgi:hypothetical protein
MLFNKLLNHIPKYHSFKSNPMLIYSCSPVLNYSIYKWFNWVIQCFINPCSMLKCNLYYLWVNVDTFFNGIVIAQFDTYVIQFICVIPSFIHVIIKHKDFITYILDSSILSNHFESYPPNSQIYLPQSTILLPYLSCHKNLKEILNCKSTLPICLSCLIMFGLYGVFMMCYFCVIACMESYVFC